MPRINSGEGLRHCDDQRQAYLSDLERQRDEFEAGFRRSSRGNLWRRWDESGDQVTLSVFRRQDGRFAWCIAGPDGPRFSKRTYDDEEWAIGALWDVVGPYMGDGS